MSNLCLRFSITRTDFSFSHRKIIANSSTVTETQKEEEQLDKEKEENEGREKLKQELAIHDNSEVQAFKYIKEKVEEYKTIDNQRGKMIKELADKIEALPGIRKSEIARIISNGFRRLDVASVNTSYVYQVLGDDYKDPTLSNLSKESKRRLKVLGVDSRTGDTIMEFDDIIDAKLDLYSPSTLRRIVELYKKEMERLETENIRLREQIKVLATA